jgi:hypothetical protein
MALIQFSSIVSGARNSVGGQTYSQNKGGAYVKSKPLPTQPRTAAQRQVRANFATNSKAWSGVLSDAQRSAWTFFAQANPYTNIFGASKILSGIAMSMKLNQVLAQIGVAYLEDAPSDLSVPTLAEVTSLSSIWSTGTITTLSLATAAQSTVAGARYYVFATKPLAPGKTAGVSDFRYIGNYAAVAAATSVDILADYTNTFTDVAAAGTHVTVLVATVNHTTGAVTPGLKFDSGGFS